MDYKELFHPAAPVSDPAFLVGRNQELNALHMLLGHKAEHPVIVGTRGIGKTSVLKVIARTWQNVGVVNCTTNSTFDDIAKAILDSLGFDVMLFESVQKTGKEIKGSWSIPAIIEAGANANTERERTRIEIGQVEVDEHLLYRILVRLNKSVLITIDEYDLVQDKTTKVRLADFIKMISDNEEAHKIRIVFAGVATSKRALIGAHPSVARQTHEVFLHPLKPTDFLEYMTLAENKLGIQIYPAVKEEVADICMGQPYYLHLLCIEAIEVTRERDPNSRRVTYEDYQIGRERASHRAFNDQLIQFGPALNKVKANLIAFDTLKILCQSSKPSIPKLNLLKYAEKTRFQALNDVKVGLEVLQEQKIVFVTNDGQTITFADPLLRPFLMLRFKELRQKRPSQQLDLFNLEDF